MTISKIKSRQNKHNAIDIISYSPNVIPMITIDPDDLIPSTMRGKHILVLGATGRLGSQVVNQALEASYHVTALVRNDHKLPFARYQLRNPNLVIMVGSVVSRKDLDKVIEGQDIVINCIGPRPLFPSSDDIDICSYSQKLIIESMIDYKVRRLIVVTSQNVIDLDYNDKGNNNYNYNNDELSTPSKIPMMQKFFVKIFSGKILNDKKLQETIIINNSDHIDWTIIRPGKLYNGQLTKQYKLNDKSNFTKVSRANVAHFIMKELRNSNWLKKTPNINS